MSLIEVDEDEEALRECSRLLGRYIPPLDTLRTEKFLTDGLFRLSSRFTALDSSRPWIMYWVTNGLALMDLIPADLPIEETLKPLLSQGGLCGNMGQMPHLAPTYAGTLTLALGDGSYTEEERSAMYAWILRLKNPDGSFHMHEGGESDIRALYCALVVCSLMNMLTDDITHNAVDWIVKCQTYEGGMGGSHGLEAHGGYAYCALAALAILIPINEIGDYIDLHALVRWLAMRQTNEGGYCGRTNKLVDGCYSWWVGACWRFIPSSFYRDTNQEEKSLWNKKALDDYIRACCQAPRGGLRDKPFRPADFYHTCYCLAGLSVTQQEWRYNKECQPDLELPFHWHQINNYEGPNKLNDCHPIFCIPETKAISFRLNYSQRISM